MRLDGEHEIAPVDDRRPRHLYQSSEITIGDPEHVVDERLGRRNPAVTVVPRELEQVENRYNLAVAEDGATRPRRTFATVGTTVMNGVMFARTPTPVSRREPSAAGRSPKGSQG